MKKIDIELMRIFAAFFVIFNHTGSTGFFLFSGYDSQSIHFWAYLCLSIFCTFPVPLFFMITGALMLDKQTVSYKNFLKTKVLRMILILFFWSLISYFLQVSTGEAEFDIRIFLKRLYTDNWNYSYWYLYNYIALLISLPILQKIAKSLNNKDFLWLFAVSFFSISVLPSIQYLFTTGTILLNGSFRTGWLSSSLFLFPLLGYFLQHRATNFWNKKRLAGLWIINIAAILLASYLTYCKAKITGVLTEGESQTFHSTFVLINSTTVFVTCQAVAKYISKEKIQTVIRSVGGATFGIYLVHAFLLNIFRETLLFDRIISVFPDAPMLSILLYCCVIYWVAYCITMFLKHIPRFIS